MTVHLEMSQIFHRRFSPYCWVCCHHGDICHDLSVFFFTVNGFEALVYYVITASLSLCVSLQVSSVGGFFNVIQQLSVCVKVTGAWFQAAVTEF